MIWGLKLRLQDTNIDITNGVISSTDTNTDLYCRHRRYAIGWKSYCDILNHYSVYRRKCTWAAFRCGVTIALILEMV